MTPSVTQAGRDEGGGGWGGRRRLKGAWSVVFKGKARGGGGMEALERHLYATHVAHANMYTSHQWKPLCVPSVSKSVQTGG
jgi:hypothetical protein